MISVKRPLGRSQGFVSGGIRIEVIEVEIPQRRAYFFSVLQLPPALL